MDPYSVDSDTLQSSAHGFFIVNFLEYLWRGVDECDQ